MPATTRPRTGAIAAGVFFAALIPLLLVQLLRSHTQIEAEAMRLESIAAEAAADLDARSQEAIRDPEDAESPAFLRQRAALRRVAERHGLSAPMYTLRPAMDEAGRPTTTFVVMTNVTPYIGHAYALRDEMRPVFERGERSRTGLYRSDTGLWISGYAPIRQSDGQVVALVSADRPSEDLAADRLRGLFAAALLAGVAAWLSTLLPALGRVRQGPISALRRLFTSRLSARIGLAGTASVLVAVVLIAVNDYRLERQDQLDQLRRHLASTAALAAMQIDVEAHQAVAAADSADVPEFGALREQLRRIHEVAGLRSPLYTLRRDGGRTRFVVMTNETPFVGDPNELRPRVAESFETGRPGAEGPYADAHGQWVSAWAPLVRGGEVVAVVQADAEVSALMSTLADRSVERGMFALLGVLVAFGAAGLLARGIARPIEQVAHAADRIQRGDFQVALPEGREDEVGALARSINRMSRGLAEREQLRDMFGKYMAAQVVRELLDADELSLEGEVRQITVLLSDIRGYTALTEALGAKEVVSLLNEYFAILVDAVVECDGVIDKFMGDAMLCWFGAPMPQEDHRERGLRAATQILERLGHWNAERAARGLAPVATGIGLACGEVVVGNIGSPQRLEYTAIGDAVNLASRLCSKAGEGEILVTGDIQAVAAARGVILEPLGPISVKGITEPVEVHRLTLPTVRRSG